jgi:ribose transport system substrate-binding protein
MVLRRALVPVGLLMATTALVAACSSSTSSSSQSTDSSSQSPAATAAGSAAAASACQEAAATALTAAEAPVTLTLPTQPVKMASIKGKTVWLILPDEAAIVGQIADGVKAAAAAAGLKLQIFSGNGEVTLYNQGVTEAVSQHAAGIILLAVAPKFVSGPLAQAAAEKIPVIDTFNGSPGAPLTNNLAAHVTVNFVQDGRNLADYVMAKSGCNVSVGILTTSLFQIFADDADGFQEQLAAKCPGCKVYVEQIANIADASSEVPADTQNLLRAHPAIKYVLGPSDNVATFEAAGIQQAGSSAKVLGHDGVDTNLDAIRAASTAEVADASFPPIAYIGWTMIDEMGRVIAGQSPVTESLPTRLIDASNIGASNAALFPAFAGYQAGFEKLWGVGG